MQPAKIDIFINLKFIFFKNNTISKEFINIISPIKRFMGVKKFNNNDKKLKKIIPNNPHSA